jgi:hypothetical protein
MAFTPSGQHIGLRYADPKSRDATLGVFDAKTGELVTSAVVKGGGRGAPGSTACAISPAADWVSYGEEPDLRFLAIPPRNPPLPGRGRITLSERPAAKWAEVWLDAKGRTAVVARRGDDWFRLEEWDLVKESGRRLLQIDAPGILGSLAVNLRAGRLAVSVDPFEGKKPRIECWTLADKPAKVAITVRLPAVCLASSVDGKLLAAGFGDGSLVWYDFASGVEIKALQPLGKFSVAAVAFHPDGKYLAFGSADNKGHPNLFVVDTATGNALLRFPADPDGVSSVCFSPDGKLLAVFGAAGEVKVWETKALFIAGKD